MEEKKKESVADLSNIREVSVKEDRFRINHYSFMKGQPFEDLVTRSAPYFHFQILKPEDEEQRKRALSYFNEQHKLFVAWVNFPHILLYLGATEEVYIRSKLCEQVGEEELKKVLEEAGHWYRIYGFQSL